MKNFFNFLFYTCLISIAVLATACSDKRQDSNTNTDIVTSVNPVQKPNVPDWHKNATIYEVNLRQYTPEGTFNAFAAHLPRLKKMGVDILWFMPIQPISVEKRKGGLGSPYAVADYKDVNPEHGTMEDFKNLLDAIHAAGMYCIIDWVPNHTGWDNPWITEHPNWYTQDEAGNIIDPIDYNTGEPWGWTDVADLNYDNQDMRLGMIDALKYWVKDIGIDGFRMDVAHGIPVDFWTQCSDSLYAIKPLFLLAEAEAPEIVNNKTFVSDYAWETHHLFSAIARTQGQNSTKEGGERHIEGRKTALDIDSMLMKKEKEYTSGYQMQFTSNHDENSWKGTEFKRLGDGHLAFAVLAATFNGIPMIYSGMESAMDKQLEFFEKDEVEWGNYVYADFYTTLFNLKHKNEALWNGEHGGSLVKIPSGNDENIYAFTREKNGDKVVVIINLSKEKQAFQLEGNHFTGKYNDVFGEKEITLENDAEMVLDPWQYLVLSN